MDVSACLRRAAWPVVLLTTRANVVTLSFSFAFSVLSALLTVSFSSTADAQPATDFYLHGTGADANPPTLFLNTSAPTGSTAKYKDSTSVNFSGGNPWKEVGTWPANPVPNAGVLTALAPLHVWLGLKNSDDQGTNFDVRAEISRNGTLVVAGQTLCITGITRNPANALEATVSFGSFDPQIFNGTSDGLSLKILTRIGTNPDGTKCAGHNNAVGLRLYFDATNRMSQFGATIGEPAPVPTALVPDPLPITVGATGTLTATLTPTPTTAGALAASSSAPAVATVPAAVAFSAGQDTVLVPVTAVSQGSTLITVSLNGGSVTSTAQVTPAPSTVTSLVPETLSITQGGSGTLTVTISSAQTTDTAIALSSSDPGVAFVPSSVTVVAGQVDASISVGANSPGNAQITASLNGTSATSTITVTPAPPTVVSVLPATSSVTLGATTSVTVTISAAQPTDTVVALSTNPTGIISVPAAVSVLAGQTTAEIPVGTVALGTASVQASLNGTQAEAAVQVVPPTPMLVSLVPSEVSIEVGATSTFTLTLNAAQQTNTVVSLEVDHPERLLAPASVTVPAGAISASFTVTGQAIGDVVITATLNGTSLASTIHVVPVPPTVVSLEPSSLSIQQDANGTFTLGINVAQPTDTIIGITNSAPAVLQAPSSVTVPAGDTSTAFSVLGLSPGSATVTASINATSVNAAVQVTPIPTVVTGLSPSTLSLPKGSPGVLHVTVSPASPDPQTVTLTSSHTTVAQVPTTVTVPAGGLGADFPVFSVGEGQATVTATLGSGGASAQVTVTAAELTTITVSPEAPTIFVGEELSFTATGTYTDGTTQDLTASVTWSSSDQTVATIDTAGAASALTTGSVTITAASGPISDSTVLMVQIPPPPTISGFTPTSGPVGAVVTITGTNFGSTATASFNGVQASITSATSTTIVTSVPTGAMTGPITVTTVGGSTTSAADFTVTSPHIVNVSPASGPIGTAVTITGQNFDPVAANNQVRFNGTAAIITSATATTIETTVPMNATTGPVTVTTSLGTASSPQPFEVTLSSDFSLGVVPATLSVLQNSNATALVSVSSTGDRPFTRLAALSVSGLPAGVTAVFDPPQVTAGRSGNLRITVSGTTPAGDALLTITGEAEIDGQTVTHSASMTLSVLIGGQTSVAGQFLTVDGEPIPGVQVRLGTVQTATDAAGNFLLTDVPSGTQQLMIDANAARPGYPMYAADVTLTANQTTVLPPFRITPPPPPERYAPIDNATIDQIITDPRYPGLQVTLPAGVTITGWDGVVKTQIALERVDPDRLPVLPPDGGTRSFYQIFFGTPMGGVPSAPLPVAAPNDLDLEPGEQAELWYYNASPMGGPAGWSFAGMGTVSDDGGQIVSDPGVGIQRFCGVCGLFCWITRLERKPSRDPDGPTGGDPVDLALGQQIVEKTDLVLPGRLPIALSRTYNPYDPFDGAGGFPSPLGRGWTLSVDVVLLPVNQYLYRLVLPGNTRVPFSLQLDGTFRNTKQPRLPQFVGAVLSPVAGGGQQIRFKDGTTWKFLPLFGGAMFLVEQSDRVGNRVTIQRGSGAIVQSIQDSAGRAITVQSSGGRITQLSDPLGRTVQYSYGGDGRLSTVTDPEGGVTTYTYNEDGGIATITDARNITYLTNEYTGKYLTRQTLADGGVYRFYYRFSPGGAVGDGCPGPQPQCPFPPEQQLIHSGGSTVVIPILVETVVRDPRGDETRYQKVFEPIDQSAPEPLGPGQAVTDALGQITITAKNLVGQPVRVTEPLGRTTSYTYDAAGNLTTITDSEGHVTQFAYEPTFNRVTTITDALNQVTRFEYDAQGNLTAVEDPTNARTTLTYNAFGQPTSVTDALNNTTQFEYDSVGNLVATIDPLGNTTRRAYDAVSRLIALTEPRGFTTQYGYDDLNRLTQITDALGGITAFSYDPNGNLRTVTDANDHTTTHTYDTMDRLETRTDPLNRTESYTYDLNGNLATFTDRKGQLSQFTYDAVNRRTQAQYVDSTVTFSYDSGGRLIVAEDSTAGRIERSYDTLDRLVQELTPQGVVEYTYDVLGRRNTMTVNGMAPVSYQYDAASRLTHVAQGSLAVGLGYDVLGRRSRLTYPNGTSTTYTYDPASRLTRILHQGPTAVIEDLTYTYDAAGNRVSFTRLGPQADLPDPVQAGYDAANEQVQFNSVSPNLTYDANGNLMIHAGDSGATSYTWDGRNRLILINGPSATANFTYDAFGRRVNKRINGVPTAFQYDRNDIVSERGGATTGATYVRSLNIDEPFIRRSDSDEYYHADALGSVLALSSNLGLVITTYSYDAFGRTTSGEANANSIQYTGRENDGTGLYYYRQRYFNPTLYRFISEDAVFRTRGNFYAYTENNPIIGRDPFGLYTVIFRGGSGTSGSGDALEVLADTIRAGGETVELLNAGQTSYATANAEAAAARGEPVNLIGHSLGGDAAVTVAGNLLDSNITVNNLVTIDSFSENQVSSNVANNVNFYETNGPWPLDGTTNVGAQKTNNILINADHFAIAKDPAVRFISCVTVLSGRKNVDQICGPLAIR